MRQLLILLIVFSLNYTSAQNTLNLKAILEKVDSKKDMESVKRAHPECTLIKHTLTTGTDCDKKLCSLNENEITVLPDSSFIKLLSKTSLKEFKVK